MGSTLTFGLRRHAFGGACALLLAAALGCAKGSGQNQAANPPAAGQATGKAAANTQQPAQDQNKGPQFPRPDHVRGIYVTAWSAGTPKKLDELIALCKNAGLNAMVIDVRDTGEMYWDNDIPLAKEAHADLHAIPDPKKVMDKLAANGIYPIARIACFRDNYVPKAHPELAVQLANGKVWRDRSGHSWLDPYNKKNWDYMSKTVNFALDVGFNEIQLDYVRFPSEGKSSTERYPARKEYGDGNAKPEDVIGAFAKFITDQVKARGAYSSADIFGIISTVHNDQGIGQLLKIVSGPFDVISPMDYPSHFSNGMFGIKDPNSAPYETVFRSLTDTKNRLPDKQVRPWLQAFTLRGVHYGDDQVYDQIKAARDCGYDNFLLWNAGNKYPTLLDLPAKEKQWEAEEAAKAAKAPTQPANPAPADTKQGH